MAGDWIKMRNNLWDDPRVARMCDLTGQSEASIVGALYWLWASADEHTEDGLMPGLSIRQIDRKTSINGFGQALCDIGWLADHPDGVCIVRFEEHNGASAKRRCMEAKRKAEGRSVSASDADKLRTECAENRTSCGAREEKNKEELKTTTKPKRAKRALFDPLSIELPSCVETELWASWIAYRREMKFTVKERATREQVAFLEEMNTKGHNLKEIVQISVRNGWQGLFEPKAKTNSTYHDSIVACGKAIFGDLSNGPIDITPTSREVDSEDFFRITG